MKLEVNLSADLEAKVIQGAEAAGLDLPHYILQILRALDADPREPTISDEQFEQSLQRLRQIHSHAPSTFDDSRESIYS